MIKTQLLPPGGSTMDLKLNDIFWTIQGEGREAGERSLFIRLPYCNYSCPWCDTEYNSINFNLSDSDLKEIAFQEKARLAILTGGEPSINKQLPRIIQLLKKWGFRISIETNGSWPVPEGVDFLTISPKKYTNKALDPYYIHPDVRRDPRPKQYKYVIEKGFDASVLSRHESEPQGVHLYLSPEFNDMDDNVGRLIAYMKEHPRWKMSLQTHKWIKIK